MKTFAFIAGLLVAATAVAQLPPPEATQAETDAGLIGSKYVSPRRAKNASWASGSPTGGVTVAQLATTNYIPRVLVSDATPQDPYRWMNLTNGLLRFPAWSSDRIVGSLTPGIHFYSVTNGADHFSIDVQHDHAAAGKSEARLIGLWDMAIVPGYNSGIQLGASTDNYNQEVHVQYANRMGWSHLFNLRGNTNGNIGSISLQGRRISTTTNLSELWIWANEPTWNTYPTPGFSATGPQIAKLAIGGTYFYSDLYTPRTIVTNRQLIGAGPMFYSTDGGMELSSGYSDGFMVGGDLGAATRTTGSSKYFWMTMTPKTHSDARMNLLSAANDGATTATINIGGGSGGATAPANRVKIWAGADSTANGTGSLGIDVSNGLVTTTNLVVGGSLSLNGTTGGILTLTNPITGASLNVDTNEVLYGNVNGATNSAGAKLANWPSTNGASAGNVITYNGAAVVWTNISSSLFYQSSALVTNVNFAGDSNLFTITIPAGTLRTTNAYDILVCADIYNNGTAGIFTNTLSYGSTVLWKDTIYNAVNTIFKPVQLRLQLASAGTTSSQILRGTWNSYGLGQFTTGPLAGVGSIASSATSHSVPIGGTAAEDSTAALAFTWTCAWTNANANQQIILRRVEVTAK